MECETLKLHPAVEPYRHPLILPYAPINHRTLRRARGLGKLKYKTCRPGIARKERKIFVFYLFSFVFLFSSGNSIVLTAGDVEVLGRESNMQEGIPRSRITLPPVPCIYPELSDTRL